MTFTICFYIGGRTLRRAMLNGIDFDMRDGSGTYYDSAGRPTRWDHIDTATSGTVVGFDLTYDRMGNPTAINFAHDTNHDFSDLDYDSSGRLVAMERPAAWTGQPDGEQWTLDGVGNWSYYDGLTSGSRLDTSFNEYYSIEGASQSHDDNGNLTDDGELAYEWDAFNRLVRVMDGATIVATYTYDSGNRRVRKSVYGVGDTAYALDGWRTLGEYASATAANPDRQFVFGVYLDEPLVMDVNSDFDSTCLGAYDDRYFYHQNWQYSVIALSDANADLVEGYSYDPYGRHLRFYNSGSPINFDGGDTITAMTASALGNPFTYTGQRFDDETALHHYKERYYSTTQGCFLARDPLRNPYLPTPNLYSYTSCCPILAVDPSGLQEETVGSIEVILFQEAREDSWYWKLRGALVEIAWRPPEDWSDPGCSPCRKAVWIQNWYPGLLGFPQIRTDQGFEVDWDENDPNLDDFTKTWIAGEYPPGDQNDVATLFDQPSISWSPFTQWVSYYFSYHQSLLKCIEGDDAGKIYYRISWGFEYRSHDDSINLMGPIQW